MARAQSKCLCLELLKMTEAPLAPLLLLLLLLTLMTLVALTKKKSWLHPRRSMWRLQHLSMRPLRLCCQRWNIAERELP